MDDMVSGKKNNNSAKSGLESSVWGSHTLRVQIPVAAFILATLVTFVLCLFLYQKYAASAVEFRLSHLKKQSTLVRPLLLDFYQDASADIELLHASVKLINKDDVQGRKPSRNLAGIEQLFRTFLMANPIYHRITYIDNLAENSARKTQISLRREADQVLTVPANELTTGADINKMDEILSAPTAYHNASQYLYSDKHTYFSAIELKRHQNQVVRPHLATMWIIRPIDAQKKGEGKGGIILELDFTAFIQSLRDGPLANMVFYLANASGDFLYHPNPGMTFGFDLDERYLLQDQFPLLQHTINNNLEYQQILALEDSSINSDFTSGMGVYSKISLSNYALFSPLHLLLKEPFDTGVGTIIDWKQPIFLLVLLLPVLILFLAIIASRRFILPLNFISKSISHYQESGDPLNLPVTTSNEIGVLASNLNTCFDKNNGKLRQQQAAITQAEDIAVSLQGILNSIADAVVNINQQGQIVSFNQSAQRMFGYSEAEVLHQNINILMPERNEEQAENDLLHYLNSGITSVGVKGEELLAIRQDGEIFPMYFVLTEAQTNEGKVYTGLIRDVTANKLMEEERIKVLKKTKELAWRLDFALAAPGIGVWDYHVFSGKITWDERMYLLYGISAENGEDPNKIWKSRMYKEDLKLVEAKLIDAVNTGDDLNTTFRIRLPDDSTRYLEAHAKAMSDGYGNIIRLVGTNIDVTEQQNLQNLKQEALNMAEESLRLKSAFLASMSHEIRTPMNGVLGMLGLLEHTELSKTQQHYIELASSSAQSLLTLINDILDFSKIEAGKLELEIIDFDIRNLLGNFVESMAIRAQEKGIELILDVVGLEQSMVKGDPGRLRQVLTNLVGNAIKFTRGGEIVLKASLTTKEGGVRFDCCVSDTGIGIPDDKVTQLFESFTQVDSSTTRKYGGTGLGLAIVKQLCQLMAGDIFVSSTLGVGSSFSFHLNFQISSQKKVMMPKINIKGTRILIVDDNKTNLEVLKTQLEQWGAKVTQTTRGADALALIEQMPSDYFAVAILDLQMPDMDGAMLGQRIHGHDNCKNTKLIMMTSMGERGDASYFAGLGFSAYFPKPATTSDLFDALTVVVDGNEALQMAKPLVTTHHLRSLQRLESQESIAKGSRILLVEDNKINQAVVLGVLSLLGLSVDVANNGVEAIAMLNSAKGPAMYQVILMDCQMPEMDGYEASREIRKGAAGEEYLNVPIIAMTANAMKGDKEKCLSAGMSDYTSKPVDTDIVEQKLAFWLKEERKTDISQYLTATRATSLGVVTSAPEGQVNDAEETSNDIWDKKGFMKRIRNNEKIARSLVKLFIEEMPSVLESLQLAITEENFAEVASYAHKVKGTVNNIGGINSSKIVTKIEAVAKEHDITRLNEMKSELTSEFDKFMTVLNRY